MAGFHDIIGHDMVKDHLQKAIEYHKVSHAYILSGEEGMGRKTIARAFAMTLLCEKSDKEPCMQCHSCKQIMSGNHPDVIWVTHEKPASIGVDDIRVQINDTIMVKPYSSGYVVSGYLSEMMEVPESKADIYAAFARGNLGKAIHLASSEEFSLLYKEVLTLLKNIKEMDIPMLLDYIKKLQEDNLDLFECLDFMQLWYRDILMFKVTKDINTLVFKDEYGVVSGLCQKSSYEGLETILNSIEKAKARLNANVNTELALELMLLTMKEN